MEEEKIKNSDNVLKDNDKAEWIDIKSDTDRQTNREIVLAINSLIFEECEEIDEDMKLDNQFKNL